VRAQRFCLSLVVFVSLGSLWDLPAARASENWPQWRGPNGNGTSDSTKLPTEWSLTKNKNIVWKAQLPWWSGGTPVIWGDRVFVTSPTKGNLASSAPAQGSGDKGPGGPKGKGGKGGYGGNSDPGGETLLLLCLSKKDGSLLWQRELDTGNRLYRKQNCSSPSPVTDGKHVWAVTGTGAVAAFDLDGKEREVVRLRFGLEDDEPRTLQEIGDRLHLSRERVRQIESRAKEKLRRSAKLRSHLN